MEETMNVKGRVNELAACYAYYVTTKNWKQATHLLLAYTELLDRIFILSGAEATEECASMWNTAIKEWLYFYTVLEPPRIGGVM